MRRIVIGLTPSSFEKIIQPYKFSSVKAKLEQHAILFSPILIEYYKEYFKDRNELNLFEGWISTFGGTSMVKTLPSQKNLFEEELATQVKQQSHSILLYADEKIADRRDGICYISINEIEQSTSDDELSKYCIPFDHIIKKGYEKKLFTNWIKELLSDATDIIIIDPYIISKEHLLKDCYMPLFPQNAKVTVFYNHNKVNPNTIKELEEFKDRIKIIPAQNFHDRYICSRDKISIFIGVGLALFNESNSKTRVDTQVVISNKMPSEPSKWYDW